MGSCDNPAVIEEPFSGSVTSLVGCSSQLFSKKQSRQEIVSSVSNSCDGRMFGQERGPGVKMITAGICMNALESAAAADGTTGDSEHIGTLLFDEGLDSYSGVSRLYDVCNLDNGSLSLHIEEKQEQDIDCLVGTSGCQTTFEVTSSNGSSLNRVKPDELDKSSATATSTNAGRDDTIENGDIVAQMDIGRLDLKSSSHICDIVSNVASVNRLPCNFIHQNELDIDGVNHPFSEVVDAITDVSTITEADMFNGMSSLPGDEKLSEHMGRSVTTCNQYSCLMNGQSLSSPSGETVIKVADMKNNPKSCLQVLPSEGCQKIRECLQSEDLSTVLASENDQCDEKSINNSSTKCSPKVVEGHNVITNTNGDAGEVIFPKIEHECNFNESVLLQAFSSPSQSLDVEKALFSETLVAADLPTKGISSVNSCSAGDHDNNNIEKVGCVTEVKFPDTITLSSQTSGQRRTSSKQKKASRKSRKKVPKLHKNIETIFDAARRKRSCISKPARSSIWGSLGYIGQFFQECDGATVNQSQKQRKKNARARGNKGSANRNKKQPSEGSQSSRKGTRGKCATSTNCIRLKVKLGKQGDGNFLNIVVPEVFDSSLSAKAVNGHYGNESYWDSNFEFPPLTLGVKDQTTEDGTLSNFFRFSKNLEKGNKCLDASVMKEQFTNNDSSCTILEDKSSAKIADDNLCTYFHSVGSVERASETRGLDPETSPDSEVINSVLDATRQENLQDSVLASAEDFVASANITSSKKGRKKNKLCQADSTHKCSSSVPASRNKSKSSKKHGRRMGAEGQLGNSEIFTPVGTNVLSYSLTSEELSLEQVPLSAEAELPEEAVKEEGILEVKEFCKTAAGSMFSESENSKTLVPSKSARKGHSKSLKSVKTSKCKSKAPMSENQIKKAPKERVYQRKSVNKSKVEKAMRDQVVTEMQSHQVRGNCLADNPKKSDIVTASSVDVNLHAVQGAVEQYTPPRNAWVLCDNCHKWRRIPASLVDSLGQANCTWTCKDNVDKAFADCSIPQEKSNAEINAELEISDDSGEENASTKRLTYKELECLRPTVNTAPQENKFASISSNQFLHRGRKNQTIDEIMVCHCKRPLDGQLGCGDECLNRMLNIECVRGTCPCGDLCSNQQFQKRKYAKLKWLRCGKKGYGLQLLENISKGKFLIEYVGEVLDMHAYEARQKEYALNGHRHFYFMTLNGSEVIDACGKGNLGRFINHSCDPNCRTEKWMVNGEICIGLFARRDIKKGEEVTFDYNYVRVFGAAAKKCYCGSPQCRGYIGGDPLNSEVIIQSDSDEEFPEPVMLRGDGRNLNKASSTMVSSLGVAEMQPLDSITGVRDKRDKTTTPIQMKITEEREDPLNLSASTISPLQSSLEFEESKLASPAPLPEIILQTEDVTSKPMFVDEAEITLVDNASKTDTCLVEQVAKSLSYDIDSQKKSKLDAGEDKQAHLKQYPRMKTSRKQGSIKKGKVASSSVNVEKVQFTGNRQQMPSFKLKRLIEGSPSSRFEAVEEKLNDLLDTEGGISKRKDAPKGYLKLLLLTAASGASGNGEAIQSNRDLSMILDALLKTRSRVVLNDIINKNGLRMLHNIMKQYRSDFKKIPILRKLLKVLEYLVAREILTSEHINGGPPCPGMESLRESLLSLTDHDDKQVHQIARNFRDKWFPRHVRKFGYTEREDGRLEVLRGSNCSRFTASHGYRHDHDSRPTEAIDCVKQSTATSLADTQLAEGSSVASTSSHSLNGQKTRKRKSRWDQPADTNLDLRSKELKLESTSLQQFESSQLNMVGVTPDHMDKADCDDKNSSDFFSVRQQEEAIMADSGVQNGPEDIPPGFSSPFNPNRASSSAFSTATDPPEQSLGNLNPTVGHPQERFISRLPVSYGIPFSTIQQYGTSHAENLESWDVAPGIPFHPFPPLPPYPRGKCGPPTSPCDARVRQSADGQFNSHNSHASCSEECTPSTTGTTNQQDLDIPLNNEQIWRGPKESSYDLGRMYFRQQKWRNTKFGPPRLQRRNQWGYPVNNFRSAASTVGVQNVENEGTGAHCSGEASFRVDNASDDFHQHLRNENQG